MFLVGSKGTFRVHQEHMLLELRAHQKHVLLELRAQQTAHFEPKVVFWPFLAKSLLTRLNYLIHGIIYAIFDHDSEETFFMSQYL